MNAVEIEEAISALAELPFDGCEFPFAFLQAFGNKETTIKKLRAGEANKSDLSGVLQRNHIHIAVAPVGGVPETLACPMWKPPSHGDCGTPANRHCEDREAKPKRDEAIQSQTRVAGDSARAPLRPSRDKGRAIGGSSPRSRPFSSRANRL